jgi:Na+/H+-dicarboxylate symporter
MYIRDKQTIMSGCQNLVEALTRITGWIARITPIGTFIIIASKAGTIEFSTINRSAPISFFISYAFQL